MTQEYFAFEDAATVAELYGVDFHEVESEEEELDFDLTDDLPVGRPLDFGQAGLFGRLN